MPVTVDVQSGLLITGNAGTGKTMALQRLALQAVNRGFAVSVFEEHGDWAAWEAALVVPHAVEVMSLAQPSGAPAEPLARLADELAWLAENPPRVPVLLVLDGLEALVPYAFAPRSERDARSAAREALARLLRAKGSNVSVVAAAHRMPSAALEGVLSVEHFEARAQLGPAKRANLILMFGASVAGSSGNVAVERSAYFSKGHGLIQVGVGRELVPVQLVG